MLIATATLLMLGLLLVTMWIAIASNRDTQTHMPFAEHARDLPRPLAKDAHDYVRGDQVVIPRTAMEDEVSFFVHQSDDRLETRFFVVNLPDTEYQVALDTCRGCYEEGLGYVPVDKQLVCRKCDFALSLPLDESVTHDCQPIPLAVSIGDELRLALRELHAFGQQYAPK